MFRRLTALALVAVVAGACGKKAAEPAVTPTPTPGAGINRDSIDAARRADSIRAAAEAERARLAALEAARAALVNELAETIHFDYDQFTIGSDDRAKLERKAAIMRANAPLRIRIIGHADERGSDEYNLALGMRRAVAAKDFLVALGIEAARIEVASLGEEVPVDPTANEDAWAKNRRDEFEIVAGAQSLVAPGR